MPAYRMVSVSVTDLTSLVGLSGDSGARSRARTTMAAATPMTIPRAVLYAGTGIAKRSKGPFKTEYSLTRKPTNRKPKKVEEIDLGAKLGICRYCTCPVHEADITDGYAEACEGGTGFECIQIKFADSCREYAANHPEDVAAMLEATQNADEEPVAEAIAEEPANEATVAPADESPRADVDLVSA